MMSEKWGLFPKALSFKQKLCFNAQKGNLESQPQRTQRCFAIHRGHRDLFFLYALCVFSVNSVVKNLLLPNESQTQTRRIRSSGIRRI